MIPQRYILWLYYLGVTGIAAGMTLSKPAVSTGILFCGLGWLLQGNFNERLRAAFSNRFVQVSLLFLLLHLAGLLWSDDLRYGLKDCKTKLPLLLIPVFLLGDKVFDTRRHFILIQVIFITALVIDTLLSFGIYFRVIKPLQFTATDMRTMIFGVSGVRLALFICLAICFMVYHGWKTRNVLYRALFILLTGWFLFFLNFIESGTGLLFIFILAVFSGIYLLLKHFSGWVRWAVILPFFLLFIWFGSEVYITVKNMVVLKPDPITTTHSRYGEPYITLEGFNYVENGYVIGRHTAPLELEKAWNERSSIDYYGTDKNGQQMYTTVMRYLNSMGKAKDREALEQLTDEDIRNMENGIANKLYTVTSGWKRRLMQIVFEIEAYSTKNSPFGNSITQRFEYWKIASGIFRDNLWTGTGTGDVQLAFDEVYNHYPYPVDEAFRLRAHNQYLTIGLSFGVFGLLLFLVYAFSLLWTGHFRANTYLALCFLVIMLFSFVSEDTLETQSGLTFIAFFHTLFHLPLKRSSSL